MSPNSAPVAVAEADVTLGEVNRNMLRLSGQVEKLTETLADAPKWSDVRRIEDQLRAEAVAAIAAVQLELDSVKGWQTWTQRAIIGALIGGAITLLFVFAR